MLMAVIRGGKGWPSAVSPGVLGDQHAQHLDHVHVAVEMIGLGEAQALAGVVDQRSRADARNGVRGAELFRHRRHIVVWPQPRLPTQRADAVAGDGHRIEQRL
jgi:hypothetical protein